MKKIFSGCVIKKISVFAIVLGILALVASYVVVFIAFQSSMSVAEKRIYSQYTEKAQLLHEIIISNSQKSESEILKIVEDVFRRTGVHPEDEYICIVNAQSDLVLHTRNPETVGSNVSSNQIFVKGNEVCVLNDLVHISKIEAGQIDLDPSRFNLNRLVDEACLFFKSEAERKKIQFTCFKSLSDEQSNIVADKTKVEQIIYNLLKNAFKFTKEGKIHFGYEILDDKIQFRVEDSGRGIPLHLQKNIFDRFKKSDSTPASEEEGSGLGLSISKTFVELMGGDIRVESEYGKGSTFIFTIPWVAGKEKMEKPMVREVQQSEVPTILIAEDDKISFLYLEEICSGPGVNIIRAKNGNSAVEMATQSNNISLVIMDIKLPGIHGWEAIDRIRKKKPDLPIIVQTAYASSEDRNRAFELGCVGYISKPIESGEIKKMVEQFIV